MDETTDWAAFYGTLCEVGPRLLTGIDEPEVLEIITTIAATADDFWSDGLVELFAAGASAGDLRSGVFSTLELWRENVLQALSDNFGIELDRAAVAIDTKSPLFDELVGAATPDGR